MNPPKKLTAQHKVEEQQEAGTAQQDQLAGQGAQEFATAEDMLRHDALHTPVPPTIGRRLEKSIREQGGADGPWWRRWLGGSK